MAGNYPEAQSLRLDKRTRGGSKSGRQTRRRSVAIHPNNYYRSAGTGIPLPVIGRWSGRDGMKTTPQAPGRSLEGRIYLSRQWIGGERNARWVTELIFMKGVHMLMQVIVAIYSVRFGDTTTKTLHTNKDYSEIFGHLDEK